MELRGKRQTDCLKRSFCYLKGGGWSSGIGPAWLCPLRLLMIQEAANGQSSQSDSSQLNTEDGPEHKTAAARLWDRERERERGGGGRVTLSNSSATRETTETVIPPPKVLNPAERETNKSILLFHFQRSNNTRGGIAHSSVQSREEGVRGR